MTIDAPTRVGSSFFIKTFLPGFVASILYSYAVMPIIASPVWASYITLTMEGKLIIWIISGVLVGMTITLSDIYIYQFFEGILLPEIIRQWKYKRIRKYFEKIDSELKNVETITEMEKKKEKSDEKELLELNYKASELWGKVREFPYDPDEKFFSKRRPEEATMLGNVLAEYEGYSKKQYSVNMMVFWQHLWFILPKRLQEDLDLRGAKADFPVYLSFIFFGYIFIGGLGFYFQRTTWDILAYDTPLWVIICFISIILCSLFYRISVKVHKSYGRYIKALFDLYRVDLARKLKIDSDELIPDDTERKNWRKYRKYLLDYEKPDTN